MREMTLNCAGLSQRQLHGLFAQMLEFPEWYGNNLDALFDCLTEVETDTHLILKGLENDGFRETVLDAAAENDCLTVTLL